MRVTVFAAGPWDRHLLRPCSGSQEEAELNAPTAGRQQNTAMVSLCTHNRNHLPHSTDDNEVQKRKRLVQGHVTWKWGKGVECRHGWLQGPYSLFYVHHGLSKQEIPHQAVPEAAGATAPSPGRQVTRPK